MFNSPALNMVRVAIDNRYYVKYNWLRTIKLLLPDPQHELRPTSGWAKSVWPHPQEIKKSSRKSRNLYWNPIEISKSWQNPEILKSQAKSWNLARNPEIFLEIQRFRNLIRIFGECPTPRSHHCHYLVLLLVELLDYGRGMSLLQFFKPSSHRAKLPDPRGPLSWAVPSSSESTQSMQQLREQSKKKKMTTSKGKPEEATMRSFHLN